MHEIPDVRVAGLVPDDGAFHEVAIVVDGQPTWSAWVRTGERADLRSIFPPTAPQDDPGAAE